MSVFKADVGVGNLDGGDLAPVQPVGTPERRTRCCRSR